jgi:eukaryotic translation initiation factor 2C
MTIVGRSLFSRDRFVEIPGGVEIWPGLYSSLRPTQSKALWNVDTSFTAFYAAQPGVKFLQEVFRRDVRDFQRGFSDSDRIKFERALRNLKVKTTHGDKVRKYRVNGLTRTAADRTMFESDGNKVSVADYFSSKYGVALKYPYLPCLHVGNPAKNIYIPLEFVQVVEGQKYIKKLNEEQTAEMIKVAARKPHDRFDLIKNGVSQLQNAQSEYLSSFGIQLDNRFVQIEARMLNPPTVYYGAQSREPQIVPDNGAWNMKDKQAEAGATITSWAVVNFAGDRDVPRPALQNFIRELVSTAGNTGMKVTVNNPPSVAGRTQGPGIEQSIRQACEEAQRASGHPAQIILCVMPRGSTTALYAEIKRIGETVIGIPTQCMLHKHVGKANRQYCANLLLKINSKLGGINQSLRNQMPFISEKPTIVFGADVTHPGIGEKFKPSIAAVVASVDPKLGKYASCIAVQGPREEMIVTLREISKKLLIAFYQATKCKPQRILFYRDGVSEGQFEIVQELEIAALKQACADLDANYKPTITFVIVQKRHNVRFLPGDRRDADRSGNIRPG